MSYHYTRIDIDAYIKNAPKDVRDTLCATAMIDPAWDVRLEVDGEGNTSARVTLRCASQHDDVALACLEASSAVSALRDRLPTADVRCVRVNQEPSLSLNDILHPRKAVC